MNGRYKQNERTVIIIAAIGFIFACTALAQEVMETVMQEKNGVWEANREAAGGNEQKGTFRIAENMTEANGGKYAVIHKEDAAKQSSEETEKETAKDTAKKTVKEIRLPSGEIVRGFGWLEEGGVWRYHTGIDVRMGAGARVGAAAGGSVLRAERTAGGWLVEVGTQNERWRYEPLAELYVTVGKKVCRGEELGRLANDTSELHIGCHHGGEWTDPRGLAK